MSWFNCFVGLTIVLLSTGCATAPDATARHEIRAGSGEAAVEQQTTFAHGTDTAAQDSDTQPAAVDLKDFAPNDTTGLICRDMLKPLSNVIVTYCLTPADWKTFERQQAAWAQQMVRVLQGGQYR